MSASGKVKSAHGKRRAGAQEEAPIKKLLSDKQGWMEGRMDGFMDNKEASVMADTT